MTPVEKVIAALEAIDHRVKPQSGYHQAQCPSHDDRNPSLTITEGEDGRVLLRCHAGCSTEDVVAALGLRMRDLYTEGQASILPTPAGPAEYVYTDAEGHPVGKVIRGAGKRFHQQHPVGQHWESGGCPELSATPYRLPEVLAAIAEGRPVVVTEGERDADTAVSLGVTATCNAGGAGKWRPAHAQHLAGASVVIVRDHDDPGRDHAVKVAESLAGIAESVTIVEAKAGKDLTDHVHHGYGLDDLVDVPGPGEDPVTEAATGRRLARVTWAAAIDAEPVVWAWVDGDYGRIPMGSLCLAAGREGTGKSSFGAWLTAHVTRGTLPGGLQGNPRRVLYVAVEDSWRHTLVPRLTAAGADLGMVGRFDVITETGAEDTLSLPHDNGLLEAEMIRHGVGLVVIDPLMSAIGARIDTHRERDVRTALDPLAKLAERTGAMVVGLAHFNKSGNTDAANLITGSGAFKNVPRSVLGFARDDDGRVMSQVKNSLGRDDLPSLVYEITEAEVPTKTGVARTARFAFTGASERTVSDILRDAKGTDADSEDRAERDFIVEWIKGYLTDNGGSAPFEDVKKAAHSNDIAERTLKRARHRAGVTSERKGYPSRTTWSLETPVGPQSGHSGANLPGVGPTGPTGAETASESAGQSQWGQWGQQQQPSRVRAGESGPTGGGPTGDPACSRCHRPSEHPLIAGKCRGCAYPPGVESPYGDAA